MKIIYCAGIRGDFAKVYSLLRESIAGAYVMAGDLLDSPFHSDERLDEFLSVQDELRGAMETEDQNTRNIEQFAEKLAGSATAPLRDRAALLLDLTSKARATMLKKYAMLETILASKPHASAFVIPGGSDMPLSGTPLAARSIDLTVRDIAPLRIAGIGGAERFRRGFPEKNSRAGMSFPAGTFSSLLEGFAPGVLAFAYSPRPESGDAIPGLPDIISTICFNPGIRLVLCPSVDSFTAPAMVEAVPLIESPSFASTDSHEGGFFYELEFDGDILRNASLKKISADRIYDIAEYAVRDRSIAETVIDAKRYAALRDGNPFDSPNRGYVQIPEIRMFRDIRNFFKIYQTEETEHKVSQLASVLSSLGDDYRDIALDLVGHHNIGVAQKSSDVDMVLYIRGGGMCLDEEEICSRFGEVEEKIRSILGDSCEFEIIDHVNLDLVEQSIIEGESESPVLQRFVVYRGMCRPVNYRVLAPVEDMLNANPTLRREVEQGMSEYLQVLGTTKDTTRSFDKYQARLKSMGVEIPEPLAKKIRAFLGRE
jgi:hypothetical protein